jgi:hypothetical protein
VSVKPLIPTQIHGRRPGILLRTTVVAFIMLSLLLELAVFGVQEYGSRLELWLRLLRWVHGCGSR